MAANEQAAPNERHWRNAWGHTAALLRVHGEQAQSVVTSIGAPHD